MSQLGLSKPSGLKAPKGKQKTLPKGKGKFKKDVSKKTVKTPKKEKALKIPPQLPDFSKGLSNAKK